MKSNDLVYPVYSRKVASFKVIHMFFVQVVSLCCSYCVKRAVIGQSTEANTGLLMTQSKIEDK